MARASGKPAYGEGRQALITKAVRLVARGGLGKLTYRSLAADAGVTVGAVQHNFRSMNGVLESGLEFCMDKSRGHGRNVANLNDINCTIRIGARRGKGSEALAEHCVSRSITTQK